MKTYRVRFWYTEYGTAEVHADSKKEAEKGLYEFLSDEGLSGLRNYDCNDREYGTQDAELIRVDKGEK